MTSLEKLENRLNEWLNTKAPFNLPHDVRKAIADALWAIALVVGIVQLWGVWGLWHVGHYVTQVATYSTYLNNGSDAVIHLGLFYWISFIVTALAAILLLTASPKLRRKQKSGWNLLYYAALLNAAYAVLRLLSGVSGIFGDFLGAAISAVVGMYFLFQIRDYFTGREVTRGVAGEHVAPGAAEHEHEHPHAGRKSAHHKRNVRLDD
jgi:hypothetical protein